jgi:FkbM family methyltransferase
LLNFSKSITKKAFRRIGIEVHRYNPTSSPTAQLVASLKQFGIDLIVDVGANSGQFADGIRSGGYAGKIVSIEPLTVAHAKLTKVSRNDANWDVYQRCSVGDREGEVTINIAGNSVSSSLLPMLESHLNAAPHADYIGKEIVPLLTIDSIVPDYFKNFKKPFLKIDTQGFEWQVLNGAANSLPYIQGALLEMSLTPLYEGQHLWEDILVRMKESGFTLWALQPGFTDQVNGRTYQVDGIFFRTK